VTKSCRLVEAIQENQGLTQQVWEVGLQQVMAAVPSSQPNVERALLVAYGRLHWPATDLPLCKQQLEELANEISANASCATSETDWLRLSGILSDFAPRC
jgi:hypothetical protein